VGGGAVLHDAKGNLIQEGGRSLAYDSQNRLTSATTPQSFGIAYDPQGRFRAVVLTGFVAAFDMVGTDIVAARNNGGPTSERYAFGPGVDEPMVGYDNAGFSRIEPVETRRLRRRAKGRAGPRGRARRDRPSRRHGGRR
jgi:YD repeat-containing protein